MLVKDMGTNETMVYYYELGRRIEGQINVKHYCYDVVISKLFYFYANVREKQLYPFKY